MKQIKRVLPLLTALVLVLGCFAGLAQPAHAETAGYSLWIGGVQVTEENANDVFGDGRVRFTPAGEDGKAILALSGYSYSGEGTLEERENGAYSSALLYRDDAPLEIRFTGENSLLQSTDKTVRLAAGLYSAGDNADLSLIGTDSGASLKLASGSAEVYSGALQANGSVRVEALRLEAEGGEAGKESEGVYCGSALVIRDSEISASSGACPVEASGVSNAIHSGSDATIEHSKLSLTGGNGNYCSGLWTDGELHIFDSELSADSAVDCENAVGAYSILAYQSAGIQRSTVKAGAAGAQYNIALQSYSESIVITDSSLTLESGAATMQSVGVSAWKALIVGGTSTVTVLASDTPVTGEDQTFSSGVDAAEGILIGGSGARVNAVGGTGDTAYGLSSDGGVIISDEVASVEAASPNRAVWGKVKNAVAGVGWTEPDGSEGDAAIPVSEEGAELPDYQKVRFGKQSGNPFSDLKEGAYYSDAVLWAVHADPRITAGTSETTFSPEQDCTRAQVVTFLWRAAGMPEAGAAAKASPLGGGAEQSEAEGAVNPFTDVRESAYYYNAVLWAVEQGIAKGVSDTTFGPGKTCTREQVVTFLWRAAGEPTASPSGGGGAQRRKGPAPQNPFEDVKESAYSYNAILWAVEQGVTEGTSKTTFSPKQRCTRGQVVTFLYRSRPQTPATAYRFADHEEAAELILSETDYYTNFSQNDLNYRVQKPDATLDEWKQLVRQQTRDFTDREKAAIDEAMTAILGWCELRGYRLPELRDVVLAKTTMREECGAGAYTHSTHIFLGESLFFYATHEIAWYREYFRVILAHELFHCLTRNDPDFRRDMYGLLGFTVGDADIVFSQEIKDTIISNPDVGHHDAYAAFEIGGELKNCVAIFTADPFEEPGDSFFDNMRTRLVPVDDPGVSYGSEEAANFWDVFGRNTDYVIDPEETLADNFGYTVVYGTDREYETKELIESIDACLRGREG